MPDLAKALGCFEIRCLVRRIVRAVYQGLNLTWSLNILICFKKRHVWDRSAIKLIKFFVSNKTVFASYNPLVKSLGVSPQSDYNYKTVEVISHFISLAKVYGK